MRDLGRVTPQEWRHVILFAAAVMLITTLPYVVGWLSENDAWEFGGFLFGTDDGYSYLAKMRLGARGDWLFTLRYTHEAHDGALLFLPYMLLGKATTLFADADNSNLITAMAIVFHAARIVCGFALLLVSYRFVAVFLRRPHTRMTALVLIALGGGFGWMLTLAGLGDLFGSLPIDFFVPEGYGFLIIFGLPHLALARTTMLLGLLLLFRALLEPDEPRHWLRFTLPAGVLWIVTGLCVPFFIAVIYLVLGVWGLAAWLRQRHFPWGLFWRAVSSAAIVLPLLIYTSAVFLTNDVMSEWSARNNLPSPHVAHYVFGYIVLAIPAVIALRWAWRKGTDLHTLPYILLAAWVTVMPVIVYLPINVQRRLAEGVIVPLSILTAAGLRLWFPLRKPWRRARAVVFALTLPTAFLLLLGGTFRAASPDRPLFHPTDELTAMDQLNAVAPRDAVVLCAEKTGNYLPARTHLIAYVGHGPETLERSTKIDQVERFFTGDLTPDERRALLAHIDYVFFGHLEHELAADAAFDAADLHLLYGFSPNDSIVIYEVVHDN